MHIVKVSRNKNINKKALMVIKAIAFTTTRAITSDRVPNRVDINYQLFNYTRSRLRYTMNGRVK